MISEAEILPMVFIRFVELRPKPIDHEAYELSYNGIANEIRREQRKLKNTFDPILIVDRMKRIEKLRLIRKDLQKGMEKALT